MLYILEKTTIVNSEGLPGRPDICSLPRRVSPNPYGQLTLSEVLSRPLIDIPTEPVSGAILSTSQYARQMFTTGGSPALPTLVPVSASIKQRTSNSEGWRKRADGRIIVSPMLKSMLTVHNKYVPNGAVPVSKRLNLFINRPTNSVAWSCPINPNITGRQMADGSIRHASTVPSAEPESMLHNNSATLSAQYVGTSTPEAVRPLFGKELTEATVTGMLTNIVTQLGALEFDGAMITRTISEARSGTYDVLTDIAEAKSTFQTIASCILRILRAYVDTKARTRELGKLLNRRKGATSSVLDSQVTSYNNQWLEFRYGIMPIVFSLNSAIEWFNNRQHEYFKYRNLMNRTVNLSTGSLELSLPLVTDRCFGKVRIDGQTGGLKINPLRTALEVVPLSLLLNWVCNIGDCLSALWPPSSAKQEVYTISRSVPQALYPALYQGESINIEFGYYRNLVISPQGSVHFKFELNVGWARLLDAFALAYGPLKTALRK